MNRLLQCAMPLSKVLKMELPESEVGYLALHLERILSSAF